jgi:hypothetical protein
MCVSRRTGPEWILQSTTYGVIDSDRTRLLDCARRVWPGLKAFARRVMAAEGSIDERDRFSSEVWEEVLVLAAKTLAEAKRPVLDLEAYLAASFRYRFIRKAREEKKLRERVQFLPSEELDGLCEFETRGSRLAIEDKLQVKQITQQMDEWTLTVWNSLVYGMSWKEIGNSLGIQQEQAKQKFRYELKKIKARLQGKTPGKKTP